VAAQGIRYHDLDAGRSIEGDGRRTIFLVDVRERTRLPRSYPGRGSCAPLSGFDPQDIRIPMARGGFCLRWEKRSVTERWPLKPPAAYDKSPCGRNAGPGRLRDCRRRPAADRPDFHEQGLCGFFPFYRSRTMSSRARQKRYQSRPGDSLMVQARKTFAARRENAVMDGHNQYVMMGIPGMRKAIWPK